MTDLADDEETKNTDKQANATTIEAGASATTTTDLAKNMRIPLGLSFAIDQLSDIDTVAQKYSISAKLNIDWPATDEEISAWEADPDHYTPSIIPRLDVRNDVEVSLREDVILGGTKNIYILRKGDSNRDDTKGKLYNFRKWEIQATFSEQFEVENFPFDLQDFTFCFEAGSGWSKKLIFVDSHVLQQSLMLDMTFSTTAEWTYCSQNVYFAMVDWRWEKYGIPDTIGSWLKPTVFFRLQFKRRPLAVLVRVVLWMFLLTLTAFGVFALPVDDIEGRLAYEITLVLAVIAFQFVISSKIPSVPYLTIIDQYNLFSLAILLGIIVETVVFGLRIKKDDSEDDIDGFVGVDSAMASVLFGVFAAGNLLFVLRCYCQSKAETMKIDHPLSVNNQRMYNLKTTLVGESKNTRSASL